MQKKLTLLLGIIILLFLPSISFASVFSNAYIRLDSQKPNTSLSGTACVQPSSAAKDTEAKVVIAFPSDFTISQTTSNWTTSTTNLPTGSTPWPGISSTASNVSNQGVTFNGSDLTSNTLYCFNFKGTSSTTGNVGNDKQGTIFTKNSSNVTVDLSSYALSIVNNDNINVTASVDPHTSDLQVELSSVDTGTQFSQNKTLTYKLNYGSYLNSVFPITFEANWSQGTIQGNSSPSVEIVDYVTGSADNGINGVSPVIDIVHNKITWTYSSFPANSSNNLLTFKLKTNDSYTGSLPVNFTVSAKATANTTVTPDSNVSQDYLYDSNLNPTPTPTSGPTSTPTNSPQSTTTLTPTLTLTPSLTPTPKPTNVFNVLEIRSISQNSAVIYAETLNNSKLTINYGTNVNSLSKTFSANEYKTKQSLTLNNLDSATQYFFIVKALTKSGKTINSDIFTFTTASAPPNVINENSIVVTSKNNIIYDTTNVDSNDSNAKKEEFVVIPASTNLQLKFSFKSDQVIKKAKLIVRKKAKLKNSRQVLGFNNFKIEDEVASNNVSLIEIKPGVFTATIKSNVEPGSYDLILSYEDENGNLTERKLTGLAVTNPLTVVEKSNTDEPIEGARVMLYIYNDKQRIFIPLVSSSLNITNPGFSDHNGYLDFVLPKGKYKATVTNIGYNEKNVIFTISDNDQTNYPIITLERHPLSIVSMLKYFYNSFNDVFLKSTVQYISILNISLRFFDLIATVILASFITITLFAFSQKHHIPLSTFVTYFFYLINHRERNKKYINGVIVDTNGKIIPLANIYLTDTTSEQIIASTKTNGKGEFFFKKGLGQYSLMVMKKGYKSTSQIPYEEKTDVALKITIEEDNWENKVKDKVVNFICSTIGISFETLLLLSLFFELLFISNFGIKTLPFILVSLFNLFLWILHKRRKLTS